MLYFVYLCPCLRLGLLYFPYIIFFIFFIFIAINHIISLKQSYLFILTFLPKIQPRVVAYLLRIFSQFRPGVAYKSAAYKKSVYEKDSGDLLTFFQQRSSNKYLKSDTILYHPNVIIPLN